MLAMRIADKKRLIQMALIALMLLIPTSAAYAETLTFTGNASGTIVGPTVFTTSTFSDAAFTLTFTASPASVTESGGYYYLSDMNGIFTEGLNTLTLTDVTVEVNSNPGLFYENVNFFNGAFNNGLGLWNNPALLGYGLATDVDTGLVLAASGNLSPTLLGGSFSTTGADKLEFTGDESLEFAVTGAPTPEPSSIFLLLTGLCAGAVVLRGRLV
jgi:hypothetical protein